MPHNTVAVVGAAETTKLGVIPDVSQIQLHADAALNAMATLCVCFDPRYLRLLLMPSLSVVR